VIATVGSQAKNAAGPVTQCFERVRNPGRYRLRVLELYALLAKAKPVAWLFHQFCAERSTNGRAWADAVLPLLSGSVEGAVAMTSYAWFPVSGLPAAGSAITGANTLSWATGTLNWNSPNSWIDATQISFTGTAAPSGTVPGSGTGTSGGSGADSVGLVAGSISASALTTYNEFASFLNDPTILTNNLSVDVLLNSGTVDLDNLLLAGFGYQVAALHPTLDVEGADFIVSGSIVNTYTVVLPSSIGTQSASGGGTIDLGSGATVEAGGSVQADIDFNFKDSASDILRLDDITTSDVASGPFAGTITNFGAGDTIWLPNILPTYNDTATTDTYDTTNDQVDVLLGNSSGPPTAITIDLSGPGLTSDTSVIVVADSNGGIDLVTCFAAGTRIATPRGDVAVEDLRVGDLVEVLTGETAQPVVWVGHRHLECRRHPTPQHAWPIRIRACAFGPGRPYRDLFVSPDHAIYVNDVLIPAKRLVNGSTIEQIKVDEIDYYHVELPRHGVLLANGLAAESFLDVNGNRGFFANGSDPVVLYPNLTALTWEANGCAPLIVTGPELAAARALVESFAATQAAA
jgi:hypothetical protein